MMKCKFVKMMTLFVIGGTFVIPAAFADDLDVVCGSYRKSVAANEQKCRNVERSMDRSLCVTESVVPAQKAYSACIISLNKNGAKKTVEKINSGRKPQPLPDMKSPSSSKTLTL